VFNYHFDKCCFEAAHCYTLMCPLWNHLENNTLVRCIFGRGCMTESTVCFCPIRISNTIMSVC